MVKLPPVPRDEPPDSAAYQLIVPALAVAPSTTIPVPHLELEVVPVIVGIGLTISVAGLETALLKPLQFVT